MFTQCTNCQAIFRVSMREVTISKGFLRCGECLEVFDSSKNLSTTMQDPYVGVKTTSTVQSENLSADKAQTISALDDWQHSASKEPTHDQVNLRQSPTKKPKLSTKTKTKKPTLKKNNKSLPKQQNIAKTSVNWPAIAALLLGLLLMLQLAYNYRHLFLDTLKYEPEKIQMLNHNVFAHPIDKGVLLISASIKNTAKFDQPFPTLEVRLTNSKSELVALRRFSPNEYLDNYSANKLLL